MKASVFYRTAAVLLLLFTVGHTAGFSQPPDPQWGADALVGSMHALHFNVMGFNRSYWDFFTAAGFSVAVFYVFAAILAWQLGGLAPANLARLRITAWAFALAFAAITALSCKYLFLIPIVFSSLITLCLTAAASLSGKNISTHPS